MRLLIHVSTTDPKAGAPQRKRVEVAESLTIGRGADNDLVLPDSTSTLSRRHCTIMFKSGVFFIVDTSNNGVTLDGERIEKNQPVRLHPKNVLGLGSYTLKLEALASEVEAFDELEPKSPIAAPNEDDDTLQDLEHSEFSLLKDVAGDFRRRSSAGEEALIDQPERQIPDDFNFLLGAPPKEAPPKPQSDHAPATDGYFPPPKAGPGVLPPDWESREFGGNPGPEFEALAASLAPSAPLVPQEAGGPLADALRAAGVAPEKLPPGGEAEAAERLGRAFLAGVSGVMALLAARADLKEEFHIDRTTLVAGKNNPLKFARDPQDAAQKILLGGDAAYLKGAEAVEDAISDLKEHQLAVLAGMQAALDFVVSRFNPAALEKRLDKSGPLENLLPAARKLRYWEAYVQTYKDIAGELHEDFAKEWTKRFAAAYRKRIDS